MTAWQKPQSFTLSCIYYFLKLSCWLLFCLLWIFYPSHSFHKFMEMIWHCSNALFFEKESLSFFVIFDGVASSALIVTSLRTKVAPTLKLGLGSWYSSVGCPSKQSRRRLCNEELAWLLKSALSLFAVVSCARSVKYLQVSQMQIPEDVRVKGREEEECPNLR